MSARTWASDTYLHFAICMWTHIQRLGETCKRQYETTQVCAPWLVCVWSSHPLWRTSKRTSLVLPDLFTLQTQLQLSTIHQNIHSFYIHATQSYITSLRNWPPPSSLLFSLRMTYERRPDHNISTLLWTDSNWHFLSLSTFESLYLCWIIPSGCFCLEYGRKGQLVAVRVWASEMIFAFNGQLNMVSLIIISNIISSVSYLFQTWSWRGSTRCASASCLC